MESSESRGSSDIVVTPSCCLLEATIVAQSRLGPEGQAELERLLDAFGVEISAFTADQATVAVDTWRRFGKGRHPAALNILDCCSYALARAARLPLLTIDHDFARTDIELVELIG